MESLRLSSEQLRVGLEAVNEAAVLHQEVEWDTADLKSPQQLVTKVDFEVEQRIKDHLSEHFAGHAFVGEEEGADGESDAVWYIDPIDGTTDFVYGLPHSSISLALVVDGTRKIGIVHHIQSDTTYAAVRGEGAYRDGEPISVSDEPDLDRSLFGIGFSRKDTGDPTLRSAFEYLLDRTLGVRRYGSAALQLCYTADGTFEGFIHRNLSAWDVAAGTLIVEEAGGEVTDFDGDATEETLLDGDIVATNGNLHPRVEFLHSS
ncbi:inositol monophosphatase family protein [Halosimplex pelagicum]|uniref:Inositol monophosphatase n=1 Tax=Halosimplex pelagicum TaxID=869886 RepID=A0A7D5TQG7_9EURY|nr:inositol monophosphatase family protein [Halosimplex pelagicum]QLH80472.1 inositol monophosphatase [Halosimplex pelagicum]